MDPSGLQCSQHRFCFKNSTSYWKKHLDFIKNYFTDRDSSTKDDMYIVFGTTVPEVTRSSTAKNSSEVGGIR